MLKRLQVRLNNRIVGWASVLGVGLLPCPDCGIPLAAHIWPVAAVVWVYRRVRRRSEAELDLLLSEELQARARQGSQASAPPDGQPAP